MTRSLLALLGLGVFATSVAAQEAAPTPAPQTPPGEEDVVKREEVVIVTASKVESTLINAPATVSVIGGEELMNAPSQNFGDILRNVPGMNVIQTSARDINLTSRQSTATLATSQLVLLDGRSVYLDFFGLVLWDLVPTNPQEIKQIEVVRGPASAVWGANALTGVVNIITKSPREWEGVNVNFSGGVFGRDDGSRADDGSGKNYGASVSISRAPNPTWSYRLAGGYYNSDPLSRPVGRIPIIADPRVDNPVCNTTTGAGACIGGAPYPIDGTGTLGTAFENDGTSQPKVDLRVDQEFSSGGRITYSGGYARSQGIVHTGIGPFRLENGSYLGYGRAAYTKNAFKVGAFVNFLDADSPNLLNLDPNNLPNPVQLNFKTQTFDLEVGHSKVLGGAHILSYGGNARRNNFEITLTPNVEDRNEFGGYFQWEYFKDKFRLSLGGRVDKFGNIEDPVFSPRATFMYKPAPEHALRVSFNKAFRSPSAVNNFLDQDIFAPTLIDLRPLAAFAPPALRPALSAPFRLRVRNVGSEVVTPRYNLKEESLTAYEISYTGTVAGNTTVGIALYQNDSDDNINFTTILPNARFPQGLPGFNVYNTGNAPATIGLNTSGQPVPGAIIGFLAALPRPIGPILLPRTASTYLNLGPLRQRGVELSLDHRLNNSWTVSGNYSYQKTPEPLDPATGQLEYLKEEVSLPAKHRVNGAVSWNEKRFLGTVSVNYVDKALWTDVLTPQFHGFTEAYTMVNASFGLKWSDGKVVTTLKGTNLLDETVQQHIFGDIIKRSLTAELRLTF